MALTETTTIKEVSVYFSDGKPSTVFVEVENAILRDGETVSSTTHRAPLDPGSQEAKAALGDTLAAALARVQELEAKLAAAPAQP